MSIATVEIRSFSGPDLVELDGVNRPAIIRLNVGPAGPAGPAGAPGPNSVTSATTSDGTANLSLSNVTTATATVTGTLNASHIHGNIAGSVYAHVRAGENLAKGDPVYISGSHGTGASLIAIVSKADASNAAKMPAVGVMDAAVSNNANGHMVITGTISDIDTNAYAVNSVLYVASGGGWTSTPPAANSQPVAIVERSNTNNGAVIVKVNGLASYGGNGASDANKLVRFGSDGSITVSSTLDSLSATTSDGTAVSATATQNGIAVFAESINQVSIVSRSTNSTGLLASSSYGSYIAEFENVNVIESAIERVRGWFVWFYNTFTGRLKTADITANREWTLPNKSGTILLDSDLGSNVSTFLATPTSANLAAAVTNETGTGSLVFASSPTLTSPTLTGTPNFTATNYTFASDARIGFLNSLSSQFVYKNGTIPFAEIFEDFPVTTGTHGFISAGGTVAYYAPSSTNAARYWGAVSLTTGATTDNTAIITLAPSGGANGQTTSRFELSHQVCFCVNNATSSEFRARLQGSGQTFDCAVLFGTGVVQLEATNIGGAGVNSVSVATGLTLAAGDFISGTRYRLFVRCISATQTEVYFASAPWNSSTWTTLHDTTVTHSSITLANVSSQPVYFVTTKTNAARIAYVDWVAIRYAIQR